MKAVYPVYIRWDDDDKIYIAYIPDFNTRTHGEDFYEAIEYARGMIGTFIMSYEDRDKPIPEPGSVAYQPEEGEISTWIDIDSDAYKRSQDLRAVKKNVTVPAWLLEAAKQDGLSLSKVLQEALKEQTGQYHPPGYKLKKEEK